MKLFTSMCVVLLCVSVVQAASGPPIVYTFNDLTAGFSLTGQSTATPVTWTAPNYGGYMSISTDATYAPDPNGDKYPRISATQAEQDISSLTAGSGSLFNVNPNVRQFQLSWDGMINGYAGFLVGIWIDGIDAISNGTGTTEVEHVVQFGTTYSAGEPTYLPAWRIRGAAGVNSTLDANYLSLNPILSRVKLVLDMDLDANEGEGEMSLTIIDANGSHQPPNLQDVSMCLLHNPMGDPQNPRYSNPGNWTGWYIRNQRLYGGDDPCHCVGYSGVDNLTLIPEPATLVLIGLGSLAYLRRRGRRER